MIKTWWSCPARLKIFWSVRAVVISMVVQDVFCMPGFQWLAHFSFLFFCDAALQVASSSQAYGEITSRHFLCSMSWRHLIEYVGHVAQAVINKLHVAQAVIV